MRDYPHITFQVDKEEKERYKLAAIKQGMSLSEWIRATLREEILENSRD